MQITYVSQARFPTEKAHGYQIAQVCAALAAEGHSVLLYAPTVRNAIAESAAEYYGVPATFTVRHLAHFDALASRWVPGPLAFAVSMRGYCRALRRALAQHRSDVLYARSVAVLPPLLATGVPVLFEVHTIPRFRLRRFVRLCNACRRVVCLTTLQRDALASLGVHSDLLLVEPDGTDPEKFDYLPPVPVSKERWGLPTDRPVIGYVGSLVTRDTLEKGVGELVDALASVKRDRPIYGWIVGGPASAIARYRAQARTRGLSDDDIRFQGRLHPAEVPQALTACDVLVYPAPASSDPYFQRDTSPLKLFEYLASGRSLVCADLPPLRDIVDASAVHWCVPGDSASLCDAILAALDTPAGSSAIRKALAARYAWRPRMHRIIAAAVG